MLSNRKYRFVIFTLFLMIFGLALLRVHLRIQTTIIGYEIGRFKNYEALMMEQKSRLNVDIAKLSNKAYLLNASKTEETKDGEGVLISKVKTKGEKAL